MSDDCSCPAMKVEHSDSRVLALLARIATHLSNTHADERSRKRSVVRSFGVAAFINVLLLAGSSTTLWAAPVITVVSPQAGSKAGSPVYYEADATSASCAKGIAAMRIYSSPGVSAFTTNSSHLETFIKLGAGLHNTVVQAWDNCGAVAKVAVAITVNTSAGISVFLPTGPTDTTPIHVAASAQNAKCAISAMRLYTASGVSAYTINSDELDAYVTLPPAKYTLVVQAWDKCGNVSKFPLFETVGTASDRFLYTANNSVQTISKFEIHSGVLTNPNGSGAPPQVSVSEVPNLMAAEPGGHFLYALSQAHIFAFQVDRKTGELFAVAGSPFLINGKGPSGAAMDPAGHYLYVSCFGTHDIESYRIDRSSGALTLAATVQAGQGPPSDQPTNIIGPTALTTDRTGQLIYATVVSNTFSVPAQVNGYSVNATTGKLTAVPGGPAVISGSLDARTINSTWKYVYADFSNNTGSGVEGYTIASDGSLHPIAGSPFTPAITLTDWLARAAWTVTSTGEDPGQIPDGFLVTAPINASTGALGNTSQISTDHLIFQELEEDHSGKFLYGGAGDCSNCGNTTNFPPGRVSSWSLNGAGNPSPLSGPLPTGDDQTPPNAIAVVR